MTTKDPNIKDPNVAGAPKPQETRRKFPEHRPSDRQPVMMLVDPEFIDSMGNIPGPAWEPMGYLDSEAVAAYERVRKMPVRPEHEELREIILEKWQRVIGYLDSMMVKSGSVKALRSWQTVQSFGTRDEVPVKPSSTVVPEVQNPEERRSKIGLRRR